MDKVILKGITWEHSRGVTPLLATSQRFYELHPAVEIIWKKRSLQDFADYPIEELAREFDFIIIDHPWVGRIAATGCMEALDKILLQNFLLNQQHNSVGGSHLSYNYEGSQWALAIDTATPVASYRADLLKENNIAMPETWQEVINLAKRKKIAVPAIPIDLLMNFYMFCIAEGNLPFQNEEIVIDTNTGLLALDTMKELWSLVDKQMFKLNPIAVAELMSSSNDYWYCPFAYGYSNYSRNGYAKNLLTYTDIVTDKKGRKLCSTLGGTGIAISSFSKFKEQAASYAEWVCSPEIQSTLYAENGGQPGNLAAWQNERANSLCNNFFKNTLSTLERAYIRPRYNGYIDFQEKAGVFIQDYLLKGGSPEKVLEKINNLYRNSAIITVKN